MATRRSRQAEIEKILKSLVNNGLFLSAVVASSDGLPIAMVGKADTMMIAAVSAAVKDLAERAQQGVTEITTRNDKGQTIVTRYFSIDNDLLLLVVEFSAKRTYRRLTSRAIREIKEIWSAPSGEV